MATLDINNFSDLSNLQLNGAATGTDGRLSLTPFEEKQAGSAFYKWALAIDVDTSFSTQFQFEPRGIGGTDGFTFMLQSNGPDALGRIGSGLGYKGIKNSLAIEFDTNQTDDPDGNHVALLTNGNTRRHLSFGTPDFNLNSSGPLTAWIDYDGQTNLLSVYVSETETQPVIALFEHEINLASVLGESAQVGFSGGTSTLTNSQDILNWEFSSNSEFLQGNTDDSTDDSSTDDSTDDSSTDDDSTDDSSTDDDSTDDSSTDDGHSHDTDDGHSHDTDDGHSHDTDDGHSHDTDDGHSHDTDDSHSHDTDDGHSHDTDNSNDDSSTSDTAGLTVNLSDFSNLSGLQLNGTASQVENRLRLTSNEQKKAGSVFYERALAVDADTSFSTQFQFEPSATGGADGFTFMLQSNGLEALGRNGSGLGYKGIKNSLAIEFDTNQTDDPNGNHVALLTNGNTRRHLSFGTPDFDLNGSGPLTAWIDYDGDTNLLTVYVSETDTRPATALFEHEINLASALGDFAQVGFSGGTSTLTNSTDLLNWEFSSNSPFLGEDEVQNNDGNNDGPTTDPDPTYRDELVVGNLIAPISMAALPDGRMLVLEKFGTIKVVDPQASIPTASNFLTIPDVEASGERGLLDITLDPDFENNGQFYVLYSNSSSDRLQVSRFVTGMDGHIDHAHAETETVIWEDPISLSDTFAFHQGGGLDFGPDGKIYITLGDRKEPSLVRKLDNTIGKVLRINKDGSIPSDNPFADGDGNAAGTRNNLDEVWATGLRNPFRARWDEVTGRFFIGDVGGNNQETAFEEINLGQAGAHYGWPGSEGFNSDTALADPLFAYDHKEVDPYGGSIIGGFVYRGDQLPAELQGAYIFGDFVQGWIRYLRFDGSGNIIDADPTTTKVDPFELASSTGDTGNDFDSGNQFLTGSLVALEEGTDGAVYYLNVYEGELKRIVYDANTGNQAPVITQSSADVTDGGTPLTVAFSAVANDPDNDPLTYTWVFGDGTEATGTNVEHIYNEAGAYEAILQVSDGTATSRSTPIEINVGVPPEASISSHTDGYKFRAGDQISLVGAGTDGDGTLTEESYDWSVRFIHNDHFHPVRDQTGSTFVFDIPDTGHSFADDTGFEVTLTVTDADGLQDTEIIELLPDKVNLNVSSNVPGGVSYVLDDDETFSDSFVYDTAINFKHKLAAPETVFHDGVQYVFDSWSNGATTSTIDITVPEQNLALTTNYLPLGDTFGFNFDDFSDDLGLTLNGAAEVIDETDRLQLTDDEAWQTGSVFYDQAIAIDDVTGFSTEFQFQLGGEAYGAGGADGFTFMLQSDGLNSLGSNGSGLGYKGIDNSFAIEFDTFNWKDPNDNHVAVLTNGGTRQHLAVGTPTLDLNGGDVLNAWIDYDGGTDQLNVFVSGSTAKPGTALLSHSINLNAVLGNTAYAGFSGGTGGFSNSQEILNWEMTVT